jgi:hypothetical protein
MFIIIYKYKNVNIYLRLIVNFTLLYFILLYAFSILAIDNLERIKVFAVLMVAKSEMEGEFYKRCLSR